MATPTWIRGCDILNPISMNLYSICIGIGASLGLFSLARSAKTKDLDHAIDSGLVLLFVALAGARAGYVLLHPEYFSVHPGEIAAFWLGGLSWIGCAAGLLFGMPAIVWLFKWPIAEAYHLTILLAMPLAALTWLGCWVSGVGYGPEMNTPAWLAWRAVDETGQVLPRFPLQILCAALLPLSFGLLEAVPPSMKRLKEKTTGLAGIILCADLYLFASLRADPVREVVSMHSDWLAAAALLLLSMAAYYLPTPASGKTRSPVS
ncbi:MAG: prolipoprotein diacylglyceryl transferase family protein [Anaerolineaceae bacterium]